MKHSVEIIVRFTVAKANTVGYIQQINHGTAGGQSKAICFDVAS